MPEKESNFTFHHMYPYPKAPKVAAGIMRDDKLPVKTNK